MNKIRSTKHIHSDRGTSFLSAEVQQFLYFLGIATSRSSPYNPEGNGQIERLNGTLWKTIQLGLRSKNMKIEDWEKVLPFALHSIRSLLCTSTNATPHERMFQHPRRSLNGQSMPSWLLKAGPVLLKRFVRNSKYDPLVDEVELLQPNPLYSHVRLRDGRETVVSNKHLAPLPPLHGEESSPADEENEEERDVHVLEPNIGNDNQERDRERNGHRLLNETDGLRRSTRERRPPSYLQDFVTGRE